MMLWSGCSPFLRCPRLRNWGTVNKDKAPDPGSQVVTFLIRVTTSLGFLFFLWYCVLLRKGCWNAQRKYYRILDAAGLEQRGLHTLRQTFATNLVNGVRQPDGTIRSLTPRQVADLLGHSTSEITELYYVKKDTVRLARITTGFDL